MAPPNPDPDPDGCWPSCDDQQPGVSIRPLSHADLAALLAHLDHPERHQDPGDTPGPGIPGPVLATRVRASVGRPGASAAAEYQRRCTAERARWTHTLLWRVAAVLAAGVTADCWPPRWLPTWPSCWRWRLRPHSAGDCGSDPAPTPWSGGVGPPASGAPPACSPPGTSRLGGAARPRHPRHPGQHRSCSHRAGGVLVIDGKQYRGRLHLDQYGMVWHGRHLLVSPLRKTRWQADQADEVLGIADITVATIVAIHGASVPWGVLQADGVTIVPARRVPDLLQALPPMLGPERVAWLADRARSAAVRSPRGRCPPSGQGRARRIPARPRCRALCVDQTRRCRCAGRPHPPGQSAAPGQRRGRPVACPASMEWHGWRSAAAGGPPRAGRGYAAQPARPAPTAQASDDPDRRIARSGQHDRQPRRADRGLHRHAHALVDRQRRGSNAGADSRLHPDALVGGRHPLPASSVWTPARA